MRLLIRWGKNDGANQRSKKISHLKFSIVWDVAWEPISDYSILNYEISKCFIYSILLIHSCDVYNSPDIV